MIKPKLYTNQCLLGLWRITRKIDGVRALRTKEGFVSRSGKPLYNLNHLEGSDLEIYAGSWEKSISFVKTKDGEPVPSEYAYSLDPLDARLNLGLITNPSKDTIEKLLIEALARGDEGLVLRQNDNWLKVKPTETFDVKVTGILPGKGRNKGRVGALITPMGNVGGGLTDALREELMDATGLTIEVECMELTPAGKFRHPRFKRVRYDKS